MKKTASSSYDDWIILLSQLTRWVAKSKLYNKSFFDNIN